MSNKKLEALREAAKAAGLSPSEEKFVCFDWSASQEWQEYLASLYPTPPLNKMLKWKKKFYKAHQDAAFDINSTKVDDVLNGNFSPGVSSGDSSCSGSYSGPRMPPFSRPIGSPPSATVLKVLSPLTLFCLVAGMLKTVLAAATSRRDPMASLLLTGALLLRLYGCFGLPPIKFWPLSQLGDSIANEGVPYFERVLQNDAMHGVLFSLLTGLMPNSLPLLASPLLTGSLVAAYILREGSGMLSLLKNIGPVQSFTSMMDRKRFQILQLRADLEVYFGLFFVVWSLLRMNVSLSEFFVPAYLYWQLQKIRFQTCPYTQASIRRLDGTIMALTNHRACPGVLRLVYEKVRIFCIRQVQPPEPPGGPRSSLCTIM
ncbi:hypothetical protein, conserved [Eimeria tenella]|uniref:Uncharacterized protein n=1 Tax=Eimeria tenella TaxID=5802 RepID=U6KTQ6_EIMTE|nr:hypothetical protein, conserved [Eimeria tenella]CDJ39764.1 hypothetical protein, conserved [Eimeria tenella]|eukprot:XP_013230517.1 hypothetical protein, conserved [Eimeria tenella]